MTATTTYPVHTAPTGLTTAISRTLKAEWTKFHTLPSTWRMTAMAIVTSIGLGVILCASQASQWASMSASQRRAFDPTACSLGGVFLVGVALLASLAVRSVTAEYATGMIRSTFTATPTRRLVLAAKAAVSAAFVFPVVLLCNLVSFEAGQRVFTAKHLQVSFGHPGVLAGHHLRCRRSEPGRHPRRRPWRHHPTHRRSDHGPDNGHRRRGHTRSVPSRRLPSVPARNRT